MQKFLTGYYDIEVLTIPEKKFDSVLIKQSELTKLKLPKDFIWMSMYQIKKCLQQDAWVANSIRSIISHL